MSCGCSNCSSCGSLAQYPLTLPGHAVPYHLTAAETAQFLQDYHEDLTLTNYLVYKLPVYGVIVHAPSPALGDFLVWYDANDVLHVVDVTLLPIVHSVEQPDFSSTGTTAADVLADVGALVHSVGSTLGTIAILAGIAFLAYSYRSFIK